MEQLLRIRTTDIRLGYNYNMARLEYEFTPPSMDVSREKGGLDINYEPGKLNMDTYDARSSFGYVNILDAARKGASEGKKAAEEAIARYVQEGNMMRDAYLNKTVMSDIARMRMDKSVELELGFLPGNSVRFDWEPQELSMKYEADRVNLDWRISAKPETQYVPASLEFYISQYPSVDIEYLGGIMYVPPSADPDYTPNSFNVLI